MARWLSLVHGARAPVSLAYVICIVRGARYCDDVHHVTTSNETCLVFTHACRLREEVEAAHARETGLNKELSAAQDCFKLVRARVHGILSCCMENPQGHCRRSHACSTSMQVL